MDGTVKRRTDAGISLIEVMISGLFLTVALLGIAMTMVSGISSMYHTQERLIAKQKAREAIESVFTVRSTQNIQFSQIQNTTETGGIFLTGFQPIRGTGTDGIANTADDAAEEIETMVFPDGQSFPLTGYERKVTITSILDIEGNVDPDIRQITVEVRFRVNNVWQSVSVSSYISRFA